MEYIYVQIVKKMNQSRYIEDGTEKNVIPIEKYPDIKKASGIERKISKKL